VLHYLASLKQYCHERHDFLLVMKQETVQLLNNLMSVLSSLCHVKNHSNCNFVSAITALNLVSFSSLSKCNISAEKKSNFMGRGCTLLTKLSCSVAILQMFFCGTKGYILLYPLHIPTSCGKWEPSPTSLASHSWRLWCLGLFTPKKNFCPFPQQCPCKQLKCKATKNL